MINRFIRYWNQNRKKILIAIVIVAITIFLIKAINYILSQQTREITINENSVIVDSSIPTESVITGEKLPEITTNRNMDIIEQFVELCNNSEYQNAYDLLSNDCKEEVFNTVDQFKVDYFDKIFSTSKTYELELWYSNSGNYTYRIIYYEDNILSTGQISSSNNIEDYITISTDENWNTKLNISGFINKDIINKSEEKQELTITVDDKISYRSYEIYNFTIENKTDKTIILSEGNNGNDICLIDSNEVEYDSLINEVSQTDLELVPYSKKTISIKFNKIYDEYREIEQIAFKNIILDKDDFDKNNENAAKVRLDVVI